MYGCGCGSEAKRCLLRPRRRHSRSDFVGCAIATLRAGISRKLEMTVLVSINRHWKRITT